jgi:DNA-directed RNA polymerase sigma subunit (sigma70/sigma32)
LGQEKSRRAKKALTEANLRLVVSFAKTLFVKDGTWSDRQLSPRADS